MKENLLKIKSFAAVRPLLINSPSLFCNKLLILLVRPDIASDISLTAVSRSSIISKASPNPCDALFKNLFKGPSIFSPSEPVDVHFNDTATGIEVIVLFSR